MKIKDFNPKKVYQDLIDCVTELKHHQKYKKIIFGLQESKKLEEVGLSVDEDANMYIGVNLNPEMLMYTDTAKESVELRLISEKMKKYTEFLTQEGILDSIKMDYDRIQTADFYGYVLQITFDYKKYSKKKFNFSIGYFAVITLLVILGLAFAIHR